MNFIYLIASNKYFLFNFNRYPKLFIENSLSDLKEDITYDAQPINGNTMITEIRTSRGKFWERMELQNFPIDIQELSITLASKLKQNEVKLVKYTGRLSNITSETLNTFRDQQRWKLYKLVSISETPSYDRHASLSANERQDDSYGVNKKNVKRPKFVATAFCSRRPGKLLLILMHYVFFIF